LKELGIGMTAYGVLSRGLLSGSDTTRPGDFRAHMPRFLEGNLTQNRRLAEVLKNLSADLRISASQLAIAWVLAQGNSIVPVMRARTRTQFAESLAALEVRTAPENIARVDEAIQESAVAGTRYDEHHTLLLIWLVLSMMPACEFRS
jgi:aryl-alcohol dehydrogenase-like predicted oxidoreductase